jgi:hypothetical protein
MSRVDFSFIVQFLHKKDTVKSREQLAEDVITYLCAPTNEGHRVRGASGKKHKRKAPASHG